jgi:hypothetical protein
LLLHFHLGEQIFKRGGTDDAWGPADFTQAVEALHRDAG